MNYITLYYPYGGTFGEGLATSTQPYKFGGKELDRMNGLDWSDFGARMLDSSSGLWGSIDPMAEKYYSTSPYAYCAANPILYVDPDGMDYSYIQWRIFFFYDQRIKSQSDVIKNYGNDTEVLYLGTSSKVSITQNGKTDKFSLNSNGSFDVNGKTATSEYNQDGLIHIGNDTFTDMKTANGNYYGSYLGPNNPRLNNRIYSYAIPPRNGLDYLAYRHDKGYDAKKTSGLSGALFDTSVMDVDVTFAYNCFIDSKNSTGERRKWGLFSSFAFGHIFNLKFNIIKLSPASNIIYYNLKK